MLTLLVAFLAALVLGTFVEYWGHRLVHEGWFLERHHAKHHAQRHGQGVLGEPTPSPWGRYPAAEWLRIHWASPSPPAPPLRQRAG